MADDACPINLGSTRTQNKFSRHDWVWLKQDWQSFLRAPINAQDLLHLTQWHAANRPFVVTRGKQDDTALVLRLGLSLPNKHRIALCLSKAAVESAALPLPLATVLEGLPKTLHKNLEGLEKALRLAGCSAHIFGSFAWQFFAPEGIKFVTKTSDIDLLLKPHSRCMTERVLKILQTHEEEFAHPKLDGEIILPDGCAVAWRELVNWPDKILIKGLHDVSLVPVDTLFASFATITP